MLFQGKEYQLFLMQRILNAFALMFSEETLGQSALIFLACLVKLLKFYQSCAKISYKANRQPNPSKELIIKRAIEIVHESIAGWNLLSWCQHMSIVFDRTRREVLPLYYLSMQQTLHQMLLILTLNLSILAQNCPQSFPLSSSCQFTLQNDNSDCSIFAFRSCTYQVCKQYATFRAQTHCKEFAAEDSTDWGICTQRCCDPAVAYAPTWNSLYQCKLYAESSKGSLSPAIIAALCSVSILLITLVLFSYCCCCSKRCVSAKTQLKLRFPSLSACLNMQHRVPRRTASMNGANSSTRNLVVDQILLSRSWALPAQVSQKLKDDCSICLEPAPSVQLQCGHAFHRECVCESLRFKRQCSICRSEEVNCVRVYCQKCFGSCFETTLLDHRVELSQCAQLCPGCETQVPVEEN